MLYANDIQQQTDSIVYIGRMAYPGSMLIWHLGKHFSQNKRYQAKRFSCAGLINSAHFKRWFFEIVMSVLICKLKFSIIYLIKKSITFEQILC